MKACPEIKWNNRSRNLKVGGSKVRHLASVAKFSASIIPLFLFLFLFNVSHSMSCIPTGPNLVVNGDFSQGNVGFTSAYHYTNAQDGLNPDGYYAVGSDVLYYNSGAAGSFYDHTVGNSSGSYLMCNGSTASNTYVWCQTIPVLPNTDYVFSAWTTNWSSILSGNFAEFEISINGVSVGGTVTTPYQNFIWEQFSKTWNSGSNSSATICIVDLTTYGYGNDFGIDDIAFQICSSAPISKFQSSDTVFCEESSCVNFLDLSSGDPTNWQWFFPGAFPDSSSEQNPSNVCYYVAGTYSVTLITTNAGGSDTLTVSPMITVVSAPPAPAITILGGDTLVCSQAASYQWYYNGYPIPAATDSIYIATGNGQYNVYIRDSIGCGRISDPVIITAAHELSSKLFIIYPNPATSTLFILFNTEFKDAEIIIYNMLGKEMLTKRFSGNRMEIERENLESGVYVVRVRSEDSQWIQKFIIE